MPSAKLVNGSTRMEVQMKDKIVNLLIMYDRPMRWLADQLQISTTTLWRKMNDKVDFTFSEKCAMAMLFDVDVSYFE